MALVRFLLAWLLFTFGPGIAITGRLTRRLDWLRRLAIALGAGTAAAPLLVDLLGRVHLVAMFPWLAAALAAGGLALSRAGNGEPRSLLSRNDLLAAAALVLLAVGLGIVVFAHRMETTPGGIVLYGDYDTADLSYYAAEASEAAHTVPPTASYYSGHSLNAAYYPQLVPGMIHRFAAVPILAIYFKYAWPTYLALSAVCGYIMIRTLFSGDVAALAVALVLVGSDFSYLAAWFLPQDPGGWDYVLWPTNFLSPTMQLLHFNTWGPSMPVFFTLLFAIVRGLQTRARGWIVVSALLFAILFEFKPFAWVILMAALGGAFVFAGRDRRARWHFAATAALGVVFTLPFLVAAATLDPGDRRTRLVIELFPLPKRMLLKLGLTDAFANAAARLAPSPALRTPLFLLMATVVFLAVGVGVRWLGAAGVWRAIRRVPAREPEPDADVAARSLLGWGVVAGVAIPFVLATDPYVDTLQFYVAGLYLLWIFAAAALIAWARRHRTVGVVLVAMAVALTLPSSLHYLDRRWGDEQRPPRAALTADEIKVADYLQRKTDPETTVVLHDRPLSPSLTTIVAERRIVLGWDVRYSAVGGEERLRDVNAFYASSGGDPRAALDTLRRYHVTHVIVRSDDRVDPVVLAHLTVVMQLPGVTLYTVPSSVSS